MVASVSCLGGEIDGECSEVLSNIYLQVGVEDKWSWRITLDERYKVSGVYQMLTEVEPNTRHDLQ